MIKIVGGRGSGKTTKLIEYASKNDCVIVEPTFEMARHVLMMARNKGYNIKVISSYDFIFCKPNDGGTKYLIDEIDMFLKSLGVIGYSDGAL